MKHYTIVLLIGLFSCLALGQLPPQPLYNFEGQVNYDRFGYSVAGAGDVNNDGYDDIVVGAHNEFHLGIPVGSARVFSGKDGSTIHTFYGEFLWDQFGYSVGGAGDVNNDGHADIIVGALGYGVMQSGAAYVYSGSNGALLYVFYADNQDDRFGKSVSCAGDVDGDGYDDLAVGAPLAEQQPGVYHSGLLRIFSGADGSILFSFYGDSINDFLGFSVSGAGDVNNDGYDDVIAGIPGDDDFGSYCGSSRVYSGQDGSILHSFFGVASSEHGSSVSGAGDVNNDGFADVIVGAPRDNTMVTNGGSGRVYSGFDGTVLHTFWGNYGNRIGESVSGAGDVNGDGHDDLIVGSPFVSDLAPNSGAALVYSGSDGVLIYSLSSGIAHDNFGQSICAAGDVNNDGFADVVVGAWNNGSSFTATGNAHVFSGALLPVFSYDSNSGTTTLNLSWQPDGNDLNSATGTVTCSGATPGGLGIFGVSLVPTDFPIFGLSLLIANDPVNLIDTGSFGYGFSGQITVPNVSRQSPFLAGSYIFVQFFESSPVLGSSNGLAILLVP